MKIHSKSNLSRRLRFVTLALVALFAVSRAQAGLLLGIQSVSASAGTSGNQFEVALTNTGPAPVSVAGFSFEISTANPDILFTLATTGTTDPYVFGGESLFGPDITQSTGQSLRASDFFAIPGGGATLGPLVTVGLGEISFDVAGGTRSGIYTVSFSAFPLTSVSDANAAELQLGTSRGTISVLGVSSVPEPSGVFLLLAGFLMLYGLNRRMRECRSTSIGTDCSKRIRRPIA